MALLSQNPCNNTITGNFFSEDVNDNLYITCRVCCRKEKYYIFKIKKDSHFLNQIDKMRKILFVCTGNYYRSRFAEIYFNHLAGQLQPRGGPLNVRAYSRGLEVFKCCNEGPISEYTLSYLSQLNIRPVTVDYPVQLLEADFRQSGQTIVLDEAEHRPMLKKYFPEWEDKVTYWQFRDLEFDRPEQVLPALDKHIKTFIRTFQ